MGTGKRLPANRRLEISRPRTTAHFGEYFIQATAQSPFPGKIELLLSKFGLGAESLALEFTEHALLENVDYVLAMITQLKSQGLHLSLDDFGTGYSS